ncbi:hypothetical protein [Streptomyces boninensis]|uniref:hypothetical protein n=1 Tax=Streptomyces boninensis TaxID=2039455 RepID=UPI003B21DFDF
MPDEFIELPDPTSSDGWREAMARLMPGADEEDLQAASDQIRGQLPPPSDDGSGILNAMCVGTEEVDGDERLSMGLLSVSIMGSEHHDRLMTAEGIYRAKTTKFFKGESNLQELDFELGKGLQGQQDMVLAAKLPCGPGAMSVSMRSLTLPAGDSATTPFAIPVAALQLIIPAPRDYCVYITIATPSVHLLDSYCHRLAHIGRTFAFDVQDGPS